MHVIEDYNKGLAGIYKNSKHQKPKFLSVNKTIT